MLHTGPLNNGKVLGVFLVKLVVVHFLILKKVNVQDVCPIYGKFPIANYFVNV